MWHSALYPPAPMLNALQYLPLRRCLVTPRYLEDLAGLPSLSAAGTLLPATPSPGLDVQHSCDCFCCCGCRLIGEAAPRECSRLDTGATGRG